MAIFNSFLLTFTRPGKNHGWKCDLANFCFSSGNISINRSSETVRLTQREIWNEILCFIEYHIVGYFPFTQWNQWHISMKSHQQSVFLLTIQSAPKGCFFPIIHMSWNPNVSIYFPHIFGLPFPDANRLKTFSTQDCVAASYDVDTKARRHALDCSEIVIHRDYPLENVYIATENHYL